jgi:release factor glutamine methyltransferase
VKDKADTVAGWRKVFLEELAGIYDPSETDQLLFTLLEEYSGLSKAALLASETLAEKLDREAICRALEALKAHRPVQYITGHTDFCGLRIEVDERVLIPRPETEELAGLILKDHQGTTGRGKSFLDIGTGSGCIALALKKHLPQACVHALDSSVAALEVAKKNALLNDLVIVFHRADILDKNSLSGLGTFSSIVSNPPYVSEPEKASMRRNVTEHEPAGALFVPGEDALLFYRAIAHCCHHHLLPGGKVYLEVNQYLGTEVASLLTKHGFSDVKLLNDFRGNCRFVTAIFHIPSP